MKAKDRSIIEEMVAYSNLDAEDALFYDHYRDYVYLVDAHDDED